MNIMGIVWEGELLLILYYYIDFVKENFYFICFFVNLFFYFMFLRIVKGILCRMNVFWIDVFIGIYIMLNKYVRKKMRRLLWKESL